MAALPYVNIVSTKVVAYEQLAIIFALVPACSIIGPIIIGGSTLTRRTAS